MELPDDPPGTVYTVCGGDPPPGYDDRDYIDSPVLPNDALVALRDAGGLLHDFARGKVLPPDEAGQAAWRAVRVLEKYGAELTEEWYLDVDEWRCE